jgi:hypothetical protein
MVVMTMTVAAAKGNWENGLESYKSLYFQLFEGSKGKAGHFPVAVKNLTTAGATLKILHLDNGYKTESLKGAKGFLQLIAQDDRVMVEIPGRILWTRNLEGEEGATLGLELLEPLPSPVRHMLEANMAIVSKDMKVLWDYWDEIKETPYQPAILEPASPVTVPVDNGVASGEEGRPVPRRPLGRRILDQTPPVQQPLAKQPIDQQPINRQPIGQQTVARPQWPYWAGFGAIFSGFFMQFFQSEYQFFQSEYLNIAGLAAIFAGILLVAFESILSMMQKHPGSPMTKTD